MLNSDAELIGVVTLQVQETRRARERCVRQRRSQSPPSRISRTLIAFGLIALRSGEVDPLPASVPGYAHLTR